METARFTPDLANIDTSPTKTTLSQLFSLIQPSAISVASQWIRQSTKEPLLIVGSKNTNYHTWLQENIQSTTEDSVISYLILWHQHVTHASVQTPQIAIIPLEQSLAQILETKLRSFSQSLQQSLQSISQEDDILQLEETYTRQILLLEQKLLHPVKSLAKQLSLYIQDEENQRFKSFPKIQIMYEETLYNLDDIDHLYYEKRLTAEQWTTIQKSYQAVIQQWLEALREIRQQELHYEELLHRDIRTRAITITNQCFQEILEQISQSEVITFLRHLHQSVNQTLQYTPSPHHIPLLDTFTLPWHISVTHSLTTDTPYRQISNDDLPHLWGSYENKDSYPQVELGLLLLHPQSIFVIDMYDLIRNPEHWLSFKEILRTQSVPLLAEHATLPTITVAVGTRFILTCSHSLYETLILQDKSILALLPYVSFWQNHMTHTPMILEAYYHWISHLLQVDFPNVQPDTDVIAKILYFLIQDSENRRHISCRLRIIQPILGYLKLYNLPINEENIEKAIDFQRSNKSIIWEHMLEEIEEGSIQIQTAGSAIGKVLALVVIDIAESSFGLPTLLSATATAGKDGLINIEREAGLSGEIHDKGAFIAEAFVRHQFGRYQSLSLTATLAFEQTYDGVEGDSATAAEVCAIVSAISNIPLKQSIGITGSMNQHGDLQAIGGISEKIIGFFTLCQRRGLTGDQGVILPKDNIQHLFLPENILQAIEKQQFHLWPCSHIHEALIILTGMEIGVKNHKNVYPKGTLFYHVEEELKLFST